MKLTPRLSLPGTPGPPELVIHARRFHPAVLQMLASVAGRSNIRRCHAEINIRTALARAAGRNRPRYRCVNRFVELLRAHRSRAKTARVPGTHAARREMLFSIARQPIQNSAIDTRMPARRTCDPYPEDLDGERAPIPNPNFPTSDDCTPVRGPANSPHR